MTAELEVLKLQLDLGFSRRGGRTVLDRRVFSWPFVITRTFWLDRVPADMLTVILQTGSGAVHGEDRLAQRIRVGEAASAHITTQGAAVVHRADAGYAASEAIAIDIAAGGFLEYLPEPRILFPEAALNQSIDINCACTSGAIISDAFTIHDPTGRNRSFRRLESMTRLRLGGGEPVMVDRLDIARIAATGSRAKFRAYGSIFLVAEDAPERLEELSLRLSRELEAVAGLYAAASPLPHNAGVGVKLAGWDLRSLRTGLLLAWSAFRRHRYDEPPASRRKGDE